MNCRTISGRPQTKAEHSAGLSCWSRGWGEDGQVWFYYLCIRYAPRLNLKHETEEHLWLQPGQLLPCQDHKEPEERARLLERGCDCALTAVKEGWASWVLLLKHGTSSAQITRPGPHSVPGKLRAAPPH